MDCMACVMGFGQAAVVLFDQMLLLDSLFHPLPGAYHSSGHCSYEVNLTHSD